MSGVLSIFDVDPDALRQGPPKPVYAPNLDLKGQLVLEDLDTGCWYLFVNRCDAAGYIAFQQRPAVEHEGIKWGAARLFYHLNIEPVGHYSTGPGEGWICHHCDNGPCVRPDHVYYGSAADNSRDNRERNPNYRKQHGKPVTDKQMKRFRQLNDIERAHAWADWPLASKEGGAQ